MISYISGLPSHEGSKGQYHALHNVDGSSEVHLVVGATGVDLGHYHCISVVTGILLQSKAGPLHTYITAIIVSDIIQKRNVSGGGGLELWQVSKDVWWSCDKNLLKLDVIERK